MKKNMKKYIISLGFVLLGVVYSPSVFASTIFTAHGGSPIQGARWNSGYGEAQDVTWTSSSATTDSFTINLNAGTSINGQVNLMECPDATLTSCARPRSGTVLNGVSGLQTVAWSSSYTLDPTKFYSLEAWNWGAQIQAIQEYTGGASAGTNDFGALGGVVQGDLLGTLSLTLPGITFLYPTSTSAVYDHFNNFVVLPSNTDPADTYDIILNYSVASNASYQASSTFLNYTSAYSNGDIPEALPYQNLVNAQGQRYSTNATSVRINVQANLYSLFPDFENVATATLSYYQAAPSYASSTYVVDIIGINSNGSSSTANVVATTTAISPTAPQVNTSCTPPNSITDIGGGMLYAFCGAIQLLFNPNILFNSTGYFQNQLQNLEGVPPFSAFFNLAGGANTALQSYATTTAPEVSISVMGFNTNGSSTPVNLVTLSSSTFGRFNQSKTTEALNFMGLYINSWLWIAAGIKLLYIFAVA